MSMIIPLHLFAAIIWIGGMFFSLFILRPACIENLEGPFRIKLMRGVMERFFKVVWILVITLATSGYFVVSQMDGLPWHVKMMLIFGNTMFAIFLFAYFVPFRQFNTELLAGNNAAAAKKLDFVRKLILTNFVLGAMLSMGGALGRFVAL
ncbi:hypothetical protein [Sulfuriferula nivalis]|uniref:Membrane protein n=1 Tax=Sulfuriferula nivalis TaxID=2675298 RepID=A0A809RES9_9PROT|nr:hypothetical protein [Sulfuriferula nivalis]BBO99373.1 membrane protein [Sulfuriferula nivalis]